MSKDPSLSDGRMKESYGSLLDNSDVDLKDLENIGPSGTVAPGLVKTSAPELGHDPNGE